MPAAVLILQRKVSKNLKAIFFLEEGFFEKALHQGNVTFSLRSGLNIEFLFHLKFAVHLRRICGAFI